jgi:predicted GH43/DUF377 family glycosyl hydrolase
MAGVHWEKKGLIYAPSSDRWWAQSHAHLPTVDPETTDTLRVYFAGLDQHKYGRIGYVDLDRDRPDRIVHIADQPVLDLGDLGSFDDCGVVPSCAVTVGSQKYLYYVGFQRAERVPYMLFTGLAIGESGASRFEKYARTPILDRTADEPYSRSAPYVLYDQGLFKMWYWSCIRWTKKGELIHYNNVIRYATSEDGIHWAAHPHVCVEPDFEDEFSIGRPCVLKDGQVYKMWYSIRSFQKLYAIGYAESPDGVHWVRKDEEFTLSTSDSGWDAEMICYPVVVNIKGQLHMFYNGNRHGASGFGYAVQA